jgi:hypothetical protein
MEREMQETRGYDPQQGIDTGNARNPQKNTQQRKKYTPEADE